MIDQIAEKVKGSGLFLFGDSKEKLFHSVAHDVRLDHEHERRVHVSQLELGESSRLQVLPGFPGDQATISEVVPGRLENVLEEVGPCGGVCNHMLHEEEGAALQGKDQLLCVSSKDGGSSSNPGRSWLLPGFISLLMVSGLGNLGNLFLAMI